MKYSLRLGYEEKGRTW